MAKLLNIQENLCTLEKIIKVGQCYSKNQFGGHIGKWWRWSFWFGYFTNTKESVVSVCSGVIWASLCTELQWYSSVSLPCWCLAVLVLVAPRRPSRQCYTLDADWWSYCKTWLTPRDTFNLFTDTPKDHSTGSSLELSFIQYHTQCVFSRFYKTFVWIPNDVYECATSRKIGFKWQKCLCKK